MFVSNVVRRAFDRSRLMRWRGILLRSSTKPNFGQQDYKKRPPGVDGQVNVSEMRIVHVIASIAPRLGGPSKVVLEMSAALAAQGHDVHIVTTRLAHRGSWIRWPSARDLIPVGVDGAIEQEGYRIVLCRPSWPTRWGTSLEMLTVLWKLIPTAT